MIEHTSPDTAFLDHIDKTCPICQPIVMFKSKHQQRIVEHIGAHVLHDSSVNRLSEPCRLCLQPAPLCKIILKKVKGQTGKLSIDIEASLCPNLVKFSITSAMGCSDLLPCTNHLMICPHCNNLELTPVAVVWSYNFRSHLLCKHPGISLEDHSNILVLTKLKKEGMRHVWEHHIKQQKVHWKSQHAPLLISEAHHLCLVLKYVFLFYFINNSTDAQYLQ